MDDSPFEQPVMLGEASMELTPTSTQQRRDDPQLQVKQLELGIASTEIYLEHGCFEMPVLQVSSLLVAQRERRAPFAPNSLLHHALVAAAIPWLGNDVLESYGYSSRDEALGHTIEDFEVSHKIHAPIPQPRLTVRGTYRNFYKCRSRKQN